jgi:hypothetical protein
VIAWAIFAALFLSAGDDDEASAIKPDEQVLLFATNAHMSEDGRNWIVPVHGWVFEPERDSVRRKLLIAALAKALDLDDDRTGDEQFRKRAASFLVDNERGKRVGIEMAGQAFVMPRSGADGHFEGEVRIRHDAGEAVLVQAVTGPAKREVATGQVRLVPPQGVSVISDIDDTIKKSDVLDRSELIANTFLREFAAVPGMAEAYRRWELAGAAFHYVSSSPWQLYPALEQFLDGARFPAGEMNLKLFRVKDESFFDLLASPEKTKPPVIERIVTTWPMRRFILVGDSGEKDPEVYGRIARAHPDQVLHVFIRRVDGSDLSDDRFQRAFADMPGDRWTLFDDPAKLAGFTWDADHRGQRTRDR